MSKRAKFVFVTWVGPSVSVMKKAKMSTDKALMKDIIQVLLHKAKGRKGTFLHCMFVVRCLPYQILKANMIRREWNSIWKDSFSARGIMYLIIIMFRLSQLLVTDDFLQFLTCQHNFALFDDQVSKSMMSLS